MNPDKQSHTHPAVGNSSLRTGTTWSHEFGSFYGLCNKIPPLSGSCESFWAGAEQVLCDSAAALGAPVELQPLLLQLSLQCFAVQNMQIMVFLDFQDYDFCRPSLSQDCNRTWLVLQSWR